MEYRIKEENIDHIYDTLEELENLLTDRISDLHKVKGGMQARHAYMLYRKLLWDAKYLLRDNIEEV